MNKKMSYGSKPAKYNKNINRELLKGYYKTQRYEDRKVGKQISALFQRFFEEFKKSKEKRDAESMKLLAEEITKLRKEKLFRHDFPTFASFKKYLKKEKITLKELLENNP